MLGALQSLLRWGRSFGHFLVSMITTLFLRCLRNQGLSSIWATGEQRSSYPKGTGEKAKTDPPVRPPWQGRRRGDLFRCDLSPARNHHPKDGHRKRKLGLVLAENMFLENMKRKQLSKIAGWRFVIPSMEDWEQVPLDQPTDLLKTINSETGKFPGPVTSSKDVRPIQAMFTSNENRSIADPNCVELKSVEYALQSPIIATGEHPISAAGDHLCSPAQARDGSLIRRTTVGDMVEENPLPKSVGIFQQLVKTTFGLKKSPSLRQTQFPDTCESMQIPGGRFDFHYKRLLLWPTVLTSSPRNRPLKSKVAAPSSPRRFLISGMELFPFQGMCTWPCHLAKQQRTRPPAVPGSLSCERGGPSSKGSYEPEMRNYLQKELTMKSDPPSLQVTTMAHFSNDQVVQFSMEEVQSTRYRAAHSLLGRVFTENRISTTELRESVIAPWLIQGRIRVVQAKHGLIEFMLPNEEARNWILKRSPWAINDRIIHLRAWTPIITKQIYDDLAIAPFRIQLWDVREDCCTQQFGRKMVQTTIGKVLESGVFTCQDSGSWFVKVKALIDFSRPLRSQILASNDDTGRFCVSLKYEHLPSFCFHCGRVGHSSRSCTFDPPARMENYGPHMITKKLGTRIYDADDQVQPFARGGKSVWVNRDYRQQGPEKLGAGMQREQGGRYPTQLTRQPKQMAAEESSVQTAGQRRLSPRGCKVSRSPVRRLGRVRTPNASPAASSEDPAGGRPVASMRERVMASSDGDGESLGSYPERRGGGGGGDSEPHLKISGTGGAHAGGEAHTIKIASGDARRRRLIIEDWEDESPIPARPKEDKVEVGETRKKGKRLTKMVTANDGPKVASARRAPAQKKQTGTARPIKPAGAARKKKGLAQSPLVKEAGTGKAAHSAEMAPAQAHDLSAQGESLMVEEPTKAEGMPSPKGSSSEEDEQRFVIKARTTPTKLQNQVLPGQVRQVVAAFEASMSINEESNIVQGVEDGLNPNLNEYGSNLETGTRNRSLNELEGGFEESPTPKKQFVEEQEITDSVEEASREWPQEDK
ncbi:unnamed protein product [Linum trigynum]|uniref:CCHC-type domain-containing protein n=1 Tax=Linum trigynum TaxID=586398 RepID=A0AAV2FZZ0_9ROSI